MEPGGDSREGTEALAGAVVGKLREADKLLAEGADLEDVCRHLEVSVQTYQRWRAQYRSMRPEDVVLRERLRLLARKHPRYGYRKIHIILRREGWVCNRKRVQRLWRDEGLKLSAKPRKRRRGRRMPGHVAAAYPDHVWAIDFLQDQTHDGRPVRILTITDEHTREALATPVARRMGADQTVQALEHVAW